jgi:hypothetical protein
MEPNSYTAFKEFIAIKLTKIEGRLPKGKIQEEIENTKTSIEAVGPAMFAKILSLDNLTLLQPNEWERLQKELEEHFNVEFERGVLIQGKEQRERDNSWWTSVEKRQSPDYYWSRYSQYLKKELPPEVIKTMDDDTDVVMNNIENPSVEAFSRYGMVVGHVQSGKTANYAALVCKAADAGYKFIVIIAGGLNNLRDQTQERMNESFVGQTNGVQVGAGKGKTSKKIDPLSLTTIERDFNKQDADRLSQGLNFDNISVPILLVVKKNSKTLANVIDWLQKQYTNKVFNHAMLVIDDESDYASINTNEENDPTTINRNLRMLLGLFQKSAYVAYTATPYANIFIDHKAESSDLGRDLFPKDFIYVLDAPTNYFGARKVFIDTAGRHLIPINDFAAFIPTGHKKDTRLVGLPPSLYEAIRLFLLNVAIRSLRNNDVRHNSMLIHATQYTNIHRQLAIFVEKYIKELQQSITAYGNMPDALQHSLIIQDLKATLGQRLARIEFGWSDILKRLVELVDTIVVREVHQRTQVPLEYRKDVVTNAVVIGGSSLSRGFTLIGLSVSYFLRTTIFYDTLMQMARWFGYRSGYEDLCCIYMSLEKIDDFADIIRATEELFDDFKLMADQKMTPNDFGLAVQENPSSALQVTARNKQKHIKEFEFGMRLDGKSKETSQLGKDPAEIAANIDTLKKLISKFEGRPDTSNGHFVWHAVDNAVIRSFLRSFKTYRKDPLGLTSRMPIAFIEKFAAERDTQWDVALYNGQGDPYDITDSISISREIRSLNVKDDYYELKSRQVSSGNAESVVFEPGRRTLIGSDRTEARRQMPRPLLMLHLMQPEFTTPQPDIKTLAAFGVSFPGTVLTSPGAIRLKINTVYYDNLLRELEFEEESDD